MNTNSSTGIVNSPVLVPQNLPVGWRFHPTDQEVVCDYLLPKRRGDPIDNLDIGEVQLCNHDLWDLPGLSKNKSKDKIWYFFCPREYYHKNSKRNKRKTPTGHWKPTGDTYLVTHEESDEEIGIKRILVFENPGATPWVIHEYEYTAELNLPVQGNFVLCKLMIKTNKKKKVIKRKKKAEPDCKNARPNKKARKSKSHCNMASASAPAVENSNLKRVMANSAYGDGEPSNHMISDVDNQNLSTIAAFATYEKGESSYLEALAYDSQNQYGMTSISTRNKGETSSLEASSFENQNLYQVIDVSACNKGETRCLMASDLKDHNPNEMTPMSSYTLSCPRASGLENQNSYGMTIVSTNNKGYETSCLDTFDFENQNSYGMTNKFSCDKGKPSYLITLDFENQNPGKSIDISASTEDKKSSLLEMPSDFYNQNHFTETDMSFLKDCLSTSMASNPDISTAFSTREGGEAMLKKVQNQYNKDVAILDDNYPWMASDVGEDIFPELEEELIAFCELEDCLNSEPEQHIHNNNNPQ